MKKFLSLLTVFVLALALAVPAGAYNFNGVELPMKPERALELKESGWNIYLCEGVELGGSPLYFVFGSPVEWVVEPNGKNVYPLEDTVAIVSHYNPVDSTWSEMEQKTYSAGTRGFVVPFWALQDVHWDNGGVYLEGSDFVCDGSACPATDANADGVCDDCGMVLSLRSPAPAYPSVIAIWDKTNYPYGVFQRNSDDTYSVFFLDVMPYTDNGYSLRADKGTFQVYDLVDGEWVFDRNGSGTIAFQRLDSGNILWVSHDIIYEGSVVTPADSGFFPIPLWAEMELVTQGEMMGLAQTMGGTMKTLTVCGVGCLALLAVLKLFGKRSLISRG